MQPRLDRHTKYAWVANPRIFLTCAVVEVGIFAFRSFGVFVHCTSCAMGYSYCYAVGSSICCCTPLTGVGESLMSRIWHSFFVLGASGLRLRHCMMLSQFALTCYASQFGVTSAALCCALAVRPYSVWARLLTELQQHFRRVLRVHF